MRIPKLTDEYREYIEFGDLSRSNHIFTNRGEGNVRCPKCGSINVSTTVGTGLEQISKAGGAPLIGGMIGLPLGPVGAIIGAGIGSFVGQCLAGDVRKEYHCNVCENVFKP